jgi:hypothetical protein
LGLPLLNTISTYIELYLSFPPHPYLRFGLLVNPALAATGFALPVFLGAAFPFVAILFIIYNLLFIL